MFEPRSLIQLRVAWCRRSHGLVLACALSAVTLALEPAQAADNLLENSGFENDLSGHAWMPAGWDTSDTGLPTAFFGRDTLVAHEGRYSVNVANVSTLIPMAFNWSQPIPVKPEQWNHDAVFSIWTRSNGLEGRAYLLLQAYQDTASRMAYEWKVPREEALIRLGINRIDDPIRDRGWARRYFTENTTEWVRREVRIFLPVGTNMMFVRGGLHGTGQILLDDARLTVEPARPAVEPQVGVNLLPDPGFEGDGNEWEYSLPPYRGMTVRRDTTVAHGGRASIRIQGQAGLTPARTGVGQVLCDRSLGGKRIRVSGWGRTDSLNTNAVIKVLCNGPDFGQQFIVGPPLFGTTPWTKLSSEIDVPVGTFSIWVWFACDMPARGSLSWDDVSLEVLGPATAKPSGSGAN